MKFNTWIDTFMAEKGIDLQQTFEVKMGGILHIIEYGAVVEQLKVLPPDQQEAAKKHLVQIDFYNGDVRHFLRHMGQAMAKVCSIGQQVVDRVRWSK